MFLSTFFSKKKDPWYKNAVVYQIYPWSFKDSNGDGIGDLQGIIDKLDYLNNGTQESLGVQALWISPIYTSPMKDFGYDVADYTAIDPRFGTLETFDLLIKEAHKRNIKIIMDLVTNHTSIDHPWFMESRSSKDNPKRDWYVWHSPKPDGSTPNNWLSLSGGSAWTRDLVTGDYYLHQFLPDQPDLNWRNAEVKQEMRNIIHFWLKRGVDGFRVDAMNHFIEDEKFRDDPLNPHFVPGKDIPYTHFIHTHSQNQPETIEIVNFLCDVAHEIKDTFFVTEFYLPLPELAKVYDGSKYKSHVPFNFNFLSLEWSAQAYRNFIDVFDTLVGNERIATYVFGNHDNSRVVSRLDEPRARLCAMILLTLRGVPFIYYGEELGMADGIIPPGLTKDGFATLSPKPTASRDPERTPMQWNKEKYAGFSTQSPWLPVEANYESINVEAEKSNPQSMLNLYRTLLRLRQHSDALKNGTYHSHPTKSSDVFFFSRKNEKETYYCMLNFSDETLYEPHIFSDLKILCTTHMNIVQQQLEKKEIVLRPYEGIVFTGE